MTSFPFGAALLFCPADRPDRYAKALDRADAVILDLEDAVLSKHKEAARAALLSTPLPPERTIVRINAAGSNDHEADLATLAHTEYRMVMLAKTRDAADLTGLTGYSVIALCETPAGVVAAPAIASAANVVALMWGAEDLVASLGGTSSRSRSGRYRDVARLARAQVLLAAGANGVAAIDAVYVDVADHDGLRTEAQDAAASGFAASACIHPDQVAVIRDAYRPSAEQIDKARELIRAASSNRGVFTHEGSMVDEPVLAHARHVLARAGVGSK